MSVELQERHDEVLTTFLKHRKGEATLDEFRLIAHETGYIDCAENAFQESLKPAINTSPAGSLKLHATMVQFAFRELKAPQLIALPRSDEPLLEDVAQMGLRAKPFEILMRKSDIAPTLVQFAKDLIETGRVYTASPFSDDTLSTDRGVMFYLAGKPYIFYLFQAEEPFFTILNPNMGHILAYYFPLRNMLIGQAFVYDRIIAQLKFMCLKHKDLLQHYLSNEMPSEPALVFGFMQHVGHTILNELTGFDAGLRDLPNMHQLPVLLGPHEYVDTGKLFPEFQQGQITKLDPVKTDLFEYGLKQHLLPVRPTLRHYKIKPGFRDRMARAAGRDVARNSPSIRQRFFPWGASKEGKVAPPDFDKAAECAPIIWIEVRSNHRVWLNQVDGIKTLIDQLEISHPKAAIFLAGWSRPPSPSREDNEQIALDTQVYEQIAAYAQDKLPVICGIGMTSEEKLQWAYACHACITTFGSGMTVPCLIANLPSVIHSNQHYTAEPAMHPDPGQRLVFAEDLTPYEVIGAEYITDDPDTQKFQVRGHSVAGERIYAALERALQRAVY